jgi:hypothetical protein
MFSRWMKLSTHLMMAHFEAQRVIVLRLAKLAQGGTAAETESRRMVTEKLIAGTEAMTSLASGKSPDKIVRRYRTIMRANQRRLSS